MLSMAARDTTGVAVRAVVFFVVARGIAAGATRDNLQYSDILVYDPWEINNDTLQKTMNYSWGWSVFNSIRYAVMYE